MFCRRMDNNNPNDGVHQPPQDHGVEVYQVDPVFESGLINPDRELLQTGLSELQELSVAQRFYTNPRRTTDSFSYPSGRAQALNKPNAHRGPRATNTVIQDIQQSMSTSNIIPFPESALPNIDPYEETRWCTECYINKVFFYFF